MPKIRLGGGALYLTKRVVVESDYGQASYTDSGEMLYFSVYHICIVKLLP